MEAIPINYLGQSTHHATREPGDYREALPHTTPDLDSIGF